MKKSGALRIKVNHVDYYVLPLGAESTEEAVGWHQPKEQTIYIDPGHPPSEQVRILFHELIHAFWWAYNLTEEMRDEEKVCDALESPLAALFRDNPRLGQIIRGAFSGKPLVK